MKKTRPLSDRFSAKSAIDGFSKSTTVERKAQPLKRIKRRVQSDPIVLEPSQQLRELIANEVMANQKPWWSHQLLTLRMYEITRRLYDASDPGTGKTRVHLEAFAMRRRAGGGCLLVLAPKSLLETAWQNDAAEFIPDMSSSVAYAENRAAAFAAEADLYITNSDAVNWLVKQPKSFFEKFSDIIIDEATVFKHRTSKRSKAIAKIIKYFTWRILMSGTPDSNTITDLWHQYLLLDDGVRLGTNFFQFRQAVCEPIQVGPKVNMIKWVDKEGAESAIAGLVRDITIRHKFEDCMDIPPNHTYSRKYRTSAKLMQMYKEMEDFAVLQLRDKHISAVNAAVLRNKLLQIASGAIYANDDGYEVLDRGRYELVLDLVEERAHSVVFFNWKHQRDELIAEAERRGVTYEVIDGDTPDQRRTGIVRAYQAGEFQTIFLHYRTGAHGLTLTRGNAVIWSSPIYEADYFKQGKHRVYRGGQTEPTETIMVEAEGTADAKAYAILSGKYTRMVSLLDMLGG